MTTDDDKATSWRDLADQLTPEQIARFERAEQLCMTGATSRSRKSTDARRSLTCSTACSKRRAGKHSRTPPTPNNGEPLKLAAVAA